MPAVISFVATQMTPPPKIIQSLNMLFVNLENECIVLNITLLSITNKILEIFFMPFSHH